MRIPILQGALALALTMSAAAQAPPAAKAHAHKKSVHHTSPKATAAAVNKAFDQAMMSGDSTAVSDLYTKDAELFFFKGTTLKGRDAIKGFLDGFFKGAKVKNMSVVSEESHTMGNCILDIGHYEMTTIGEDAKEATSIARYMEVLCKGKDGQWRIWRDCPLPD